MLTRLLRWLRLDGGQWVTACFGPRWEWIIRHTYRPVVFKPRGRPVKRYHLPNLVLLLATGLNPLVDPLAADLPRVRHVFMGLVSWLMMWSFVFLRRPSLIDVFMWRFRRRFSDRYHHRREDVMRSVLETGTIQ